MSAVGERCDRRPASESGLVERDADAASYTLTDEGRAVLAALLG